MFGEAGFGLNLIFASLIIVISGMGLFASVAAPPANFRVFDLFRLF